MKKTGVLFTLAMFVLSTFTFAQKASPKATAAANEVSVVYGQPSKKGRTIFGADGSGSLETYGKVWRTGANEATEITFKKDGMFGGKAVKAGTYTLYSVPGEKEWKVILNSELKQWGSTGYEKIKDKNVLEVTVPTKKFKDSAEKLTFTVKDKSVAMQWDMMGFEVPVKF